MRTVEEVGKMLIVVGATVVLIGGSIVLIGKLPFLGRLPGNIVIGTENLSCILPFATSILLSIVLTLVLNLILRILNSK